MQLTYTLEEKDYLNFQLYHVSANKDVKKQRRNTQIIVSIAVGLLGLFFLLFGERWEGVYFLIGTIPVYYLCRFYSSILYRFSIKKHIANIYRKTTPRQVSLSILDGKLKYSERGLTSNYMFSDILSITNTRKYLFFRFSETSFIILPKRELIDVSYVVNHIRDEAKKSGINFSEKTSWKWR